MKINRKAVLLVALIFLLPLSSCASNATPSNTITGIVWQWQSVTNQSTGEKITVADPKSYTITFNDDGTFNGKADCNNISGTYSQESGFSIKLGASTMAYCGEQSLDTQYL
ncbi:MAG: META domain-containing protein, partial [Anaerolineae bacterium]|nr:META domain-containing protein [Anaerolineae bacterium]